MRLQLVVRSMGVAMAVACGLALPVPQVQGQIVVRATHSIGDPFDGIGRITRASVEAYAKKLNLTADQKAAATALHEGYDTAVTQANKEFQSEMEEVRKSVEETDDASAFMEKMPKLRDQLNKKTKELEKSFMGDLQSLLTTEQNASWSSVERHRRRETQLRPGSVSGEGVNLLDVVEGLKLPADVQAKINEPLNDYEMDMDRALISKQRVLEDMSPLEPGRGLDMDAFEERLKKNREAGIKIKEVNQSHERKISGLLPDDKKAAFSDAIRKATYPTVYRQSRISKSIEVAAKFDDLNQGQKDSLAALKATYDRDAVSLNDKWASAIEEDEKKGGGGGEVAMIGGGRMRVTMGEGDDSSPLAQARKARRELDDKTRSRMDAILTKEQKERLPKEQEGARFQTDDGGSDHVIINR